MVLSTLPTPWAPWSGEQTYPMPITLAVDLLRILKDKDAQPECGTDERHTHKHITPLSSPPLHCDISDTRTTATQLSAGSREADVTPGVFFASYCTIYTGSHGVLGKFGATLHVEAHWMFFTIARRRWFNSSDLRSSRSP